MDDYLFVDKFIPSKDTKAYLHSIDYKFTDIVWEWNLGNEDFELISEELII